MTVGLVAVAATVAPSLAGAKPQDPPKPPKPKLELLTESQRAALREQRIKVRVTSRRGDRARVEATLVVGGYPSDYVLELGRDAGRLRGGDAALSLKLSARHREVLAFGAQACEPATLRGKVEAARPARFSEALRRPRRC